MLTEMKAYSGIAVADMAEARQFYADTLELRTSEEYGLLWLHHAAGHDTLVYEQTEATAASYTVLNFAVDDINEAVAYLQSRGVPLERFEGVNHDDAGVFRDDGPYIAWFKDPSGNILSVLQER